MTHRLGVEVLRDDGTPADEGEPGQVFITDYYNRLSPLVRYELGDYVERTICPCGRTNLPALGRIHGRVAGTITLRDGTRRLTANLSVAIREIPGIRQFQIIQDGIEDYTIRLVADSPVDAIIREQMERHIGYCPEKVRILYEQSIPRGPGGKLRTTINNMLTMPTIRHTIQEE